MADSRGGTDSPQVLVSAEDLLGLIDAHLDRVHDLCARLECTADEAAEITETSAEELAQLVAGRRPTPDHVGWWFGRARRLALQVTAQPSDGVDADAEGPLAGTRSERELTEALTRLDEPALTSLLLRDSYGLGLLPVSVATSTSVEIAQASLAAARTAVARTLTPGGAGALPGHVGAAALAGLAEDEPGVPAGARRHVAGCAACSDSVGQQQQVRARLAGLAVHALPDAERARVLAHLTDRAHTLLPSRARVRDAAIRAAEDDDRPLVPWIAVVVALVLAAVLGAATGVRLGRDAETTSSTGAGAPAVSTTPTVAPAPAPADLGDDLLGPPEPSPGEPSPGEEPSDQPAGEPGVLPSEQPPAQPAPASAPRSSAPAPAPAPRTSAPAPPARPLTLRTDPASGPNGTVLTVIGTGFAPGTTVQLAYLDRLGREVSSGVVTSGADGSVRGRLRAFDPTAVPGQHTVRAGDGRSTATTTFTATV